MLSCLTKQPFRDRSNLVRAYAVAHKWHVDALATMASKIDVYDEIFDVSVIRKTLRATAIELTPTVILDEQDWCTTII